MKCPHCLVSFHDQEQHIDLDKDIDGYWSIAKMTCSSCKRFVLRLTQSNHWFGEPLGILNRHLIYPRGSSRGPCPPQVPKNIANDYLEACLVLADSPKASAALSRRCLQNLLRESAGVKPGDLVKEIQQVIDSKTLPSQLAESIDAVRVIGNFAAHPNKSSKSGEILNVEPEEAEWTLDVLESLFDFYFVQPEMLKVKREALNEKLAAAGKPLLKQNSPHLGAISSQSQTPEEREWVDAHPIGREL